MLQAEQVVKEAESADDRIRLGRESRALRACAHPGVVPVLSSEEGDHPDRLVLARIGASTLADLGGPLPLESVAGLVAAIGATLADLHDLGWVHGAVSGDHVVLDERGRPVLCGFSRAERLSDPAQMAERVSEDVTALASMLSALLPPHSDRRVVRLLAGPGPRRLGRPPSARRLARRIVDLVPGARLDPPTPAPRGEGPGGPAAESSPVDQPDARRPGRRFLSGRRLAVAGGVVTAIVVVGLTAAALIGRPSPRRSVTGMSPLSALPGPAGRYVLSDPVGGRLITVMGRWGCGEIRPATLDLADGWVWMFTRWPAPGASIRARPVSRRPGAVGLAVERARPGCDDLVILGRSGARFPVPGAGTAPGT